MSGVPNGWHDDGTTLTAPNKVTVIQGFRQWILTHNWDPNNVPLLAAVGADPVELGRPELGGGTIQPCEDDVLGWTAKTNVYVVPAGHEIVALHLALNKANTQVSQLQAQIVSLEAQLSQAQSPALKDLQSRLSQINNLSRIPS